MVGTPGFANEHGLIGMVCMYYMQQVANLYVHDSKNEVSFMNSYYININIFTNNNFNELFEHRKFNFSSLF